MIENEKYLQFNQIRKLTNDYMFSTEFRMKSFTKKWIGKWYKPWTWFNKKYITTLINDADLIGISLIKK